MYGCVRDVWPPAQPARRGACGGAAPRAAAGRHALPPRLNPRCRIGAAGACAAAAAVPAAARGTHLFTATLGAPAASQRPLHTAAARGRHIAFGDEAECSSARAMR
eukprot:COSAG01_NODE_910_length_12784_cov_15.136460_9_plen_106_part_00